MSLGVEFDESTSFDPIPQPKLEPETLGTSIVRIGLVSSPGNAVVVLGVLIMLLVSGAFYILISSIPPPPQLGSDIPAPGERIPDYVTR